MKADSRKRFLRWSLEAIPLVLITLLLSGCIGSQAKVELSTSLNALGGGHHTAIIAVPGQFYGGAIFDRLPDFSLITGVRVQDYQTTDWQGVQATQSFHHLGALTGNSHFLNKAYPGDPIVFQAHWEQGFFSRDLHVQALINTGRSNALSEALAQSSMIALDATFHLHMPGTILQHNGTQVDDQTITWTLDPGMPQTLEATARVIDIPLILATLFSLGSSGLALYTWKMQTGTGNTPNKPPRRRQQLPPPQSRDRWRRPSARPPRRLAARR